MASDFGVGLGEGFGLFAGELVVCALVLTAETTISATGTATTPIGLIALFTLLVSILSFVQSMKVGSEKPELFIFGFFVGGIVALYLAWQFSDPMTVPVASGIATEIVGTFIGLSLR